MNRPAPPAGIPDPDLGQHPGPRPGARVIAAMSGGVDSAVAAARAVDAGYDVTGIHLALSRNPASYRSGARGCCTIEDANDARRAADVIGIPFYVWDLSERFDTDVVKDFMAEYAAGRTPHPCLRCNERIKFAAVLDRALGLGFDAVVSGHYARLHTGADGVLELHRAADPAKDQSYVLGVLTQDQLAHALFPLGDAVKAAVRQEAAARGLLVAEKPDSHDLCFVADGDTTGWLREKLGDRAPNTGGEIVDAATGEVLGRHEGTYGFTVGQRKGLRIGRPAPDGAPRYVLGIEPVSGTVSVGSRDALLVDRIVGGQVRWCGRPPAALGERWDPVDDLPGNPVDDLSGNPVDDLPGKPVDDWAHDPADDRAGWLGGLAVQLRAHGREHAASIRLIRAGGPERVEIRLTEPAAGVAPGQSAVVYDGTRVLGAVTIDATGRSGELASRLVAGTRR